MGVCSWLLVVLALSQPALAAFGELFAWGRGAEGQLGLDTRDSQDFPAPVNLIREKQANIVDTGSGSTTVVTVDGKVYSWGQGINEEGILVNDPDVSMQTPVLVKGFAGRKVIQLTAGECHYAALTSKGEVMTWGCNTRGALGRGKACADCHSSVPTVIPALKGRNVRQVVSGGHHVAVLTDNGEVYVWGSGMDGEIGNGAFTDQPLPVRVKALSNIRVCQLCTGTDHVAAVDTEGNLFTWGRNEFGQLGFGQNELRSSTPRKVNRFSAPDTTAIVSCGRSFTGVITRSNKVFMWGKGGPPLPTEKVFFSDPNIYPRAISAGQNHAVVLTKDHQVYTWGTNSQGQLGVSNERFFTLEPVLVEELAKKHITMISAGLNHTVALSSRPAPMLCPAFQDWYGAPDSDFSQFEAECHVDDETCEDGSCCASGTSCAQFASGSWGCCAGTNMKFCSDQVTCCAESAVCNMDQQSCERPVSYAQAAAIFTKLQKGGLKSLGPTLAAAGTVKSDGSYVSPLPVGTPIGIVGDQDIRTTVGTSASNAYSTGGLKAAETAAVNEYVKATSAYVKDQREKQQQEMGVKALEEELKRENALKAAPAIPSAMQDPLPPAAVAKMVPTEEVISSDDDLNTVMELRRELAESDPDADAVKLSRSELLRNIRTHTNLTDAEQRLLTDTELRTIWMDVQAVMPTPLPTNARIIGEEMNADGVTTSGPFLEGIRAEEAETAKKAPSIEDLEDEDDSLASIPVVEVDPVTTVAWKNNVRVSESLAGRSPKSDIDKLGVLNPPEAPEYLDDVIPGAVHLGPRASRMDDSVRVDDAPSVVKVAAMQVGHAMSETEDIALGTPRKGPCPRNAGNLECNQDCAETDNKVIAAVVRANELADQAAEEAVKTVGAGVEIVPAASLVSPSPSPSPSRAPIAPPVNVSMSNTSTTISISNVTVAVNTTVVFVPVPGFYKDPETNITYKIDGDVVTIANPAAKFASLGGKPGSANRGHCGVSRPTCPDNSCCGEGETCCQQQDGAYGCCPFEEGTCCIDQKHCCPGLYTCDIINQVCEVDDSTIAMARFAKVDQGLCGDGNRACKDGSCCESGHSCCQMFDGLQGCAPFEDATCCSDGKHACPDGSTCDVIHGVCVDVLTSMTSAISVLTGSKVPSDVELVCLADELTCPDGACCGAESTCCLDEDGYESCCPFVDGVCCGVGTCCPHGSTCDVEAGTCQAANEVTDSQNTITGRMPFMVSNACTSNENTCAATNECCAKGSSCCLGIRENSEGNLDMFQSCCEYGEDSVCCEDGTCCPFRHTCSDGGCTDVMGNYYPSIRTTPARKTDNPAASLCVDSKDLHDTAKDLINQHAQGAVEANRAELVAQEVTLMCPPFCGGPGSSAPVVDDGTWGDESENSHLLSGPGEEGVHIPQSPTLTEEMERNRLREEMMDELELLKFALQHLIAHTDELDVFSVRGSIKLPCPFNNTLTFRAQHGVQIKGAMSGALEDISPEHVILTSIREGVDLDYMINPSPSSETNAQRVADALATALLSADVTNRMLDLGFPECGRNMAISQLPGVQQEESVDLSGEIKLMEHLENMMQMFADGDMDGSGLLGDLESLRQLSEGMRQLKHSLGATDFDVLAQTDDVLEHMDHLIALLLAFMNPIDGDHSRAALAMGRARQEAQRLFGNIAKAREQSKCSRPRGPNEPPSPECESSMMPSTMRLRDADDDRYDARLQEELGSAPATPGGVQDVVFASPPLRPSYGNDDDNKPSFEMPEACTGEGCARVEG